MNQKTQQSEKSQRNRSLVLLVGFLAFFVLTGPAAQAESEGKGNGKSGGKSEVTMVLDADIMQGSLATPEQLNKLGLIVKQMLRGRRLPAPEEVIAALNRELGAMGLPVIDGNSPQINAKVALLNTTFADQPIGFSFSDGRHRFCFPCQAAGWNVFVQGIVPLATNPSSPSPGSANGKSMSKEEEARLFAEEVTYGKLMEGSVANREQINKIGLIVSGQIEELPEFNASDVNPRAVIPRLNQALAEMGLPTIDAASPALTAQVTSQSGFDGAIPVGFSFDDGRHLFCFPCRGKDFNSLKRGIIAHD